MTASANRFLDPSRFDALRADFDLPLTPVHHGPHRLKIGGPFPPVQVMGMADPVPEHRFFAANIAYVRHGPFLSSLL
jgi:hypothetical protein